MAVLYFVCSTRCGCGGSYLIQFLPCSFTFFPLPSLDFFGNLFCFTCSCSFFGSVLYHCIDFCNKLNISTRFLQSRLLLYMNLSMLICFPSILCFCTPPLWFFPGVSSTLLTLEYSKTFQSFVSSYSYLWNFILPCLKNCLLSALKFFYPIVLYFH